MNLWRFLSTLMTVVVLIEVTSSEESVYLALQQLLGVSGVERKSMSTVLPSYMMELYEKYRSGDLIGAKQGNTVRSIHPSKDIHHSGDLIFNISGIRQDENVIRAEIHYYLRPRRRHFNVRGPTSFRAAIFTVGNNQNVKLNAIELSSLSRGWHVLEVTDPLKTIKNGELVPKILGIHFEKKSSERYYKITKWKTFPFLIVFSQDKNSFQDGLVFNTTKLKIRQTRSILTNRVSENDFLIDNNYPETPKMKSTDFQDSNPMILHPRKPKIRGTKKPVVSEFGGFFPKKSYSRRKKPNLSLLSTNNEANPNNICQRKKLTVNFEQIGWSRWIIAPETFEAHYCAGACVPLTKNVRPSNHATIQSLIHALGTRENVPPPCCVPEAMSSLTLLYLDQDRNVILKNYPQMTVESCACR